MGGARGRVSQHKIRQTEITYLELARRLKKHGFKETEASITNKLKRGSFSATFFLRVLQHWSWMVWR